MTRNGFTPATKAMLAKRFKGLGTSVCPFANSPEKKSGLVFTCSFEELELADEDGLRAAPLIAPLINSALEEPYWLLTEHAASTWRPVPVPVLR